MTTVAQTVNTLFRALKPMFKSYLTVRSAGVASQVTLRNQLYANKETYE